MEFREISKRATSFRRQIVTYYRKAINKELPMEQRLLAFQGLLARFLSVQHIYKKHRIEFLLSYGGPTEWYEKKDMNTVYVYNWMEDDTRIPVRSKDLLAALHIVLMAEDIVGDHQATEAEFKKYIGE